MSKTYSVTEDTVFLIKEMAEVTKQTQAEVVNKMTLAKARDLCKTKSSKLARLRERIKTIDSQIQLF